MLFQILLLVIVSHHAFCQDIAPVSINLMGENVDVNPEYILSGDGNFLLFTSNAESIISNDPIKLYPTDNQNSSTIYLLDQSKNKYSRVSFPRIGDQIINFDCTLISASNDCQTVMYQAAWNSLDTDNQTNKDLYVYNVQTNQTKWLTIIPQRIENNQKTLNGVLSGDGRYAYFITADPNIYSSTSSANSLNHLIRIDLETDVLKQVTETAFDFEPDGLASNLATNYDGRFVVFFNSSYNHTDEGGGGIFVKDMHTNTAELISLSYEGEPILFERYQEPRHLDISDDGRYIFYISFYDRHVKDDPHVREKSGKDGFIYDRITKQTKAIPLGEFDIDARLHGVEVGSISPNGRYIVFLAWETFVRYENDHGYEEIFVYDTVLDKSHQLISKDTEPPEIPYPLFFGVPQISNDMKHILFAKHSTTVGASGVDTPGGLYLMTPDIETTQIINWEMID